MIKCALYQVQDFMAGQEARLNDLRAWAQLNSFAITGKYFDYLDGNPEDKDQGLERLELDVENHEFDVVLIHSTKIFIEEYGKNGLARLQRLVGICAAFAVPVFSISEGQLSVQDLQNWIRKTDARHKSFRDGTYMSAPPYGYVRQERNGRKQLEIQATEARVVEKIFERFVRGEDASQIADALNAENNRPKTGQKWRARNIVGEASTTRGIIRNPVYHGRPAFFTQATIRLPEARDREETDIKVQILKRHWVRAENEQLRIIEESDWRAAQARLNDRDTEVKARAARARRPLYGKIQCAICESPMKMLQGDRYYCVQGHKGKCIHTRGFSANVAERDALVKLFAVVRGRKEMEVNTGLRQDLEHLAQKIKDAISDRVSNPKSKAGNDLLDTYIKALLVWPNKTTDNERQLAITLIKPIGSVEK